MNNEEVAPAEADVQTIILQYADQLSIDRNEIQGSGSMIALGTYYALAPEALKLPLDFSIEDLSFYYAGFRKTEGTSGSGFDYDGQLGSYRWESDSRNFVRSADDVDNISIEFPSSMGSQENNAMLMISRYEETFLETEGKTAVTSVEMELTIDGQVEMSLDYQAVFDDNGRPAKIEMSLKVRPFDLAIDLVQNNGVTQINSTWKKDMNPILSSYFLIARNNLNFTPYEELAFTGKTSGYIKYREIKLDGSFDLSAVEIEKKDKQEAVQMGLYQGSRKLGRLYIDFQTEGERIIPGTVQYFIDSGNNVKVPADGLIKPLFDGFKELL